MADTLFEAKELHTYYGSSHILHGVDFHVGAGESVALMGRNGMGKTTLIRSMMGLVRPAGTGTGPGRVSSAAAGQGSVSSAAAGWCPLAAVVTGTVDAPAAPAQASSPR